MSIGPSKTITNIEKESDLLDGIIAKLVATFHETGNLDPQLIRYLTEFRLANQSLWQLTSGTKTTTDIKQAIIVGNLSLALQEMKETDKISLYNSLESREKEANAKCLPPSPNPSKNTSTEQD